MELSPPPLEAAFSLFWLRSCYYCMENLQSHLSLHVCKPLCSERSQFLFTNWPFFFWKLSHFLLKAGPFMLEIVYCSRNFCDRSPMFKLTTECEKHWILSSISYHYEYFTLSCEAILSTSSSVTKYLLC